MHVPSKISVLALAMSGCIALASLVVPAHGAGDGVISEGGTFSVTFENDIFGDEDKDYTNGLRFDYISRRNDLPAAGRFARNHLRWLTSADDWYMTYAIGQNIFTPSDISLSIPPPGERPYAGFLYGAIGIAADSGNKLDVIGLEIGMVGPSSLAEETQKLVHNIVGVTEPEGWDTQLRNEPAFRLLYERKYRFSGDASLPFLNLSADFAPHFNTSLGTIDTSLGVGGAIRIGRNLADDYGPPRVRPAVSSPGFFRAQEGFSWYLFVGVEGRAILRNLFIEGNTFGGVSGLDPLRIVGDFQAGAAVQFGSVEVAYTHVIRSPEYEGQGSFTDFGSLNLRFKF